MGGSASSVKEVLLDYTDNTAVNGIPHVPISKSIPQLIYWILACVLGVGMLILNTYMIVSAYLAYDTLTNVASINNRSLIFPQATFCSSNPLKRSHEDAATNPLFLEILSAEERAVQRDTSFTPVPGSGGPNLSRDLLSESMLSDFSDLSKILRFQRRDYLGDHGYSLKELLLDCSWDSGRDCASDSFFRTISRIYGNCYTWNSPFSDKPGGGVMINDSVAPIFSKQFGNSFGLRMTFNLHIKDYVGLLAPSYGIRLGLSNHGEFPYTSTSGIDVPPATLTTIRLRKFHDFLSWPDQPYNTQSCVSACRDLYVAQHCGCTENLNLDLGVINKTRCSPTDLLEGSSTETIADCLEKVSLNLAAPKSSSIYLSCQECRPECESTQFLMSTSQTLWPSTMYSAFMLSRSEWKNLNMTAEELQHNLARIHVFFGEDSYDSIEEQASQTLIELICDWGGIAGLFIGVSLISIFELLELIYFLAVYFTCPRKSCGQKMSWSCTGETEKEPAGGERREEETPEKEKPTPLFKATPGLQPSPPTSQVYHRERLASMQEPPKLV